MVKRLILIGLLALPLQLLAQEKKQAAEKQPERVYKLDYMLTELESGKRADSRHYVMLLDGQRSGKVRVGSRVPYATGSSIPLTQWQYFDVGVNIDATARYVSGAAVGLRTMVQVSAVAAPKSDTEKSKTGAVPNQPIVRQFNAESDVVIPLGKPTTLFTLDEPNSKRAFQVQVTASQVR